jgi:hypothetical protein
MTDDLAPPAVTTEPRKPGRRSGMPRVPGSGRKAGTPNATTAELRQLIIAKGRPLEFLCAVASGQRIRVGPLAGPGEAKYVYPNLEQRLRAATILAGKISPDMKAQEITGAGGSALLPAPRVFTPEAEQRMVETLKDVLLQAKARSS